MLRRAAKKYHVKSPKIIGEWEDQEEALKKMAHMKGGHRKTLHPGKPSQYHQVEGALRQWLLRRRGRQILVTKKMMIKRAKEVSATIRALTPTQLEEWWGLLPPEAQNFCTEGEFLPSCK